jgi:hypothetical protein
MQNWKRLLVLVSLTTAVGVASFAVEDEVNAQTAGSAGTAPTAGTGSGGTTGTGTAGTGTTDTEKKDDGGGCSVSAPGSNAGLGALVGLALGLALWRRRDR